MAEQNKGKAGGEKSPASYKTIVRILKKDKSVIEIGEDVSHYPVEKLEKWLERGMIEEAK